MGVALILTALVLAVALVLWVVAERSACRLGGLVARLQQRVRDQRREITGLHADLARYRTAHAVLAPDAVLVDEQQFAAIETYANTREDGPR